MSFLQHHCVSCAHLPPVALAKITLTLPRGSSSSELLSPNYPDSFPDDDVMEWYFQVPLKHQTNITFLNLTQPSCRKKEAAVEYHSKGRSTTVLGLNEKQPSSDGGSFTMMLRNCEMDRGRTGAPGLSLGVKVSTASTSSTGLYHISGLCCCLVLVSLQLQTFEGCTCIWHVI